MPAEHSTKAKTPAKPKKPRPGFPLYAHASGQWAKTIGGRKYYFGQWSDPEGAERRYDAEKAALYNGDTLDRSDGPCTVFDAANEFLASKKAQLDAGELSQCHYTSLRDAARCFVRFFGKSTLLESLGPKDYRRYRTKLAKKWKAPSGLTREIANRKQMLTFAYKNDLIEHPVKIGTEFRAPPKKKHAAYRAAVGHRDINTESLEKIIDAASVPLKAMILLGLNCGFGNGDCWRLTFDAIDLDAGWIRFARHKTHKSRLCPLWPKTIEALQEAIAKRPKDTTKATRDFVFLTKYGHPWGSDEVSDSPIGQEFRKLLDTLGIYRRGWSFYSLRHTHRTLSSGACDREASDIIMGHSDNSMASLYVQRIAEPRIKAVAEHIRGQVFLETKQKAS